ncbi:far upstream element-binding protein 2-like isoform X1 [Notothenia coriiceps]|uniref:Far upstream element-binding protein 2-like isoform X1 n=1 Tax=Notothenia coriiceps TaxID=8208 RepID=A0A6I9MQ48_9TELE|nr:PREDICTED: far upstream element-binding protein 2-like isoform X1 [Notothenia coriiceps]
MSEYNAVPAAGPGDPLNGQTALGNGAGGIQKDAFADAVQRARLVRRREIAAKIGVDAGPPPTNNNTASDGFPFTAQKRQLEDADEPESKKLAAQSDLDSANALSIGEQLAALAQQSSRPASNTEEYSVPDSMVGLIIGRGGEQINKIQQESGCKVQIAPDSGGLPDRSVSLTGSQDSIQNARRLLEEIVSRGRGTPPSSYHESTNGQSGTVHEMMIPAGKAGLVIGKGGETIKQLQERAGVKMILIQDVTQGPNVDKPLRIIGDPYKVQQAQEMVQDILRERDHGGFNERNDFSARMGGGMDIPIPRHSVGVVIGRNGEMIKKIQNDAGVRIQFKQDDGTGPDKIAHISGPPDCCDHASQIINDLLQSIRVRDEGQGVNGPPGPPGMPAGNRGRGGGQGGWGPPGGEMTFSIPAHKCGLVIGRGGENVKSINQQTGAFVEICRQPPPNGDPNFKIFIIRGSPQQIDHAKQLIEEKIEIPLCPVGPGPGGPGPGGPMGPYNPDPYNPGPPGGPGPPHGGPHQYPPQGWSNTYQQWQPQAPHDPSMAAANDPNAAWAAYYAQYYHQPPRGGPAQNPATPAGGGAQPSGEQTQPADQPDYSKAWEEYYKQMGQAAGGSAPAPAAPGEAAGGAASKAGGEPDYSAAWAEYYRLQASYYGPTGQAAGQPAAPQQGQVGTERGFRPVSVDPASDTETQ